MSDRMRVLVTGATGVIGARVVPQLVARGYRVSAVGRSAEKRAHLASLGAQPLALDLLDRAEVRLAVVGHDAVVNLATHLPSSLPRMLLPWSWRENDRLRRLGSSNLVDAALAAGTARFVQESFAPVYEDGGAGWIDEAWPQRPAPHTRTVLDAERSAERFTQGGGTGVVLRFAGFYGPDPLLREMIAAVRLGVAPLPGSRDAYWSSISHQDAAAAVMAALELSAGAYNVCDDEPLTRRQWADALAAAARLRPPRLVPRWLGALGGQRVELLSRSQRMSNARLRTASDWAPRFPSAREGLRAAVEALPQDAQLQARARHAARG